MAYNYTLKYRTFEQLLDEVRIDFSMYDLENLIQPGSLIKVAKRVNYDLGLRIFQTKEAILELEKHRVKLPDNFYVLNFAFICGEYETNFVKPQGTHIEERVIKPQYHCYPDNAIPCQLPTVCSSLLTCNCSNNPCTCNSTTGCNTPSSCAVCGGGTQSYPTACGNPNDIVAPLSNCTCQGNAVKLNCKGELVELVQVYGVETRHYKYMLPLRIKPNNQSIDCDCPNLYWDGPGAWIKDGYMYADFECAKIYLNYQGSLEDENGNLMVPDHDLLNEYYEYAVKERILENLLFAKENVGPMYQMIQEKLRRSRANALSFVNTPNYAELKKLWEVNRKAQYGKYYAMFSAYGSGFTKQPIYQNIPWHNRKA
jgi:hypothetical protein